MTLIDAVILGIVEGLTEFIPVSSTGHLILASAWRGLQGEAVKTFEVVIQAGAIVAVLGLYWPRVAGMARGLAGRDAPGRRLLQRLAISFLPSAVAGLALRDWIKTALFDVGPVVLALAVGGVAMIVADRLRPARVDQARTVETVTAREAWIIGLAQCLSLWPGTSRAMVTLVAGLLVGLPPTVAAEYSFLLALPTLGAATVLDLTKSGETLFAELGPGVVLVGFVTAAIVAALAMRGLLRYLTRRGLAPFGWYRLVLAGLVWLTLR